MILLPLLLLLEDIHYWNHRCIQHPYHCGWILGFSLQRKEETHRKRKQQHRERKRERGKHQNNRVYNISFYRVFLQCKEVRVFFKTILAQLPAEAQAK